MDRRLKLWLDEWKLTGIEVSRMPEQNNYIYMDTPYRSICIEPLEGTYGLVYLDNYSMRREAYGDVDELMDRAGELLRDG